MAKRRSPHAQDEETLAAFDPLLPDDAPPASEAPPATQAQCQVNGRVSISVPLMAADRPRYSARHVEVQLDNDQAVVLTQLTEALDHAGERLKSGRRIASAADGLRWLLEQIRSQLAA